MSHIVWWKKASSSYGEKIDLLKKVANAGVPLPDGFIITDVAFQEFFLSSRLNEHLPYLFSGPLSFEQRSNEMHKWILGERINKDLLSELFDAISALDGTVAIRNLGSSITVKEFEKKLLISWSNVFSEDWFSKASHVTKNPSVNILVQKGLNVRKTAVSHGNKIYANYGLEEGCFEENCDVFESGKIKSSTRKFAVFLDPISGKPEKQDFTDDELNLPCLSQKEIDSLLDPIAKLRAVIPDASATWFLDRDKWWLIGIHIEHHEKREEKKKEKVSQIGYSQRKLLMHKKDNDSVFERYILENPEMKEVLENLKKD